MIDEAFPHDEGSGFTYICRDPTTPQAFRYGCGCTATAKEVADEVAFVAAGFDDAFEKGFGFLGGIVNSFFCG